MEEFDWADSRGESDFSSPDSGFASLGPAPAANPAQALTRRELRERERAAEAVSSVPEFTAPTPFMIQVSQTATCEQPAGRAGRRIKRGQSTKVPRSRRRRVSFGTAVSTRPTTRVAARAAASKQSMRRRMLSKLMSLGAMVGVGLMMISTSIPANAFFKVDPLASLPTESVAAKQATQEVMVSADSGSLTLVRDSYTATSWKEQVFLRYGRSWAYTPNPNGTIRWPFPIAVPISDGFGWRASPCAGCSTWHKGTDFTPGVGAIIGNVMEGVVSMVDASHAGLGNHVIVDSQWKGHLIQIVYAHMMDNSFRVKVGDHVMPGDELGLVGSTGQSTGAHLHLEIHVDGVPVDPFEWLKENSY
ncbi:MAG: M23 family metallopeptidase [Cryobacterium sp.]|nr:M23 family metallopeptidase [Cryobacterium sp.]MBX3089931.1 M23 family metallopeptidase [Cryobacterium sp.]